jgi:hypothetical protein
MAARIRYHVFFIGDALVRHLRLFNLIQHNRDIIFTSPDSLHFGEDEVHRPDLIMYARPTVPTLTLHTLIEDILRTRCIITRPGQVEVEGAGMARLN